MMMLLILIVFGVEHICKEIETFINNKNMKKQIFLEYKHMIQECVDTSVSVLLILGFQGKS